MNGEQNATPERTVFSYDTKARITVIPDPSVDPSNAKNSPPPLETPRMPPPPYTFEHEREKGVFRLT